MRIYEDLRLVQSRLAVLQAVVVVLVAALVVQFWNLQVVRARHFREQAENNRSRVVTLAAPRGALVDRKGQLLVGNRPSFNVVLMPEHAENLDRVVARLSSALGMGEAAIRERLERRQPYRPVLVKTDATLADIAVLEARRLELPEVSVEVVPLRSYPLASAAAHALGRVGEISERQLQLPEFKGLPAGALVGQAGIESRYNRELMGQDGYRRVVVNSRGLEVAEAARQPPSDGPNLTLSIDASLQAAMEAAFEGRSGSAVALDPQTGEILAMTSTPAYDPNRFTTGIDPAEWASLANDPETPLMNRVIQGSYAPGSTFKVIAATAALEEGLITPQTNVLLPGAALRLQHRLPLPWHSRPRGPAARDPGVLQRLLLQRRDPARDHAAREVGQADGPRQPDRRRPAVRGERADAQPRVEAARAEDAVVRRRDGVGRDRAGTGERDAAADGTRRRLHRERRAAGAAALRPAAGCAAAAADRAPGDDRRGHGRDAPGGRGRDRLARAAPERRGLRQDRLGAGGGPLAGSRRRPPRTRSCPTAGSSRSHRQTTPGSRSRCSSSTAAAAPRRRHPWRAGS